LPFPEPNTLPQAQGIHQSDFILRTAILAGLADLRGNPDLLDWVFNSLRSDPTTKEDKRAEQIAEAKSWFLRTKIPVLMYPRNDQIEFPCITLALRASDEVERESTTGDTHYITEEDSEVLWPALVDSFTPTYFDLANGIIGVPVVLQPLAVTTTAMIVIDKTGGEHPVTVRGNDGTTIQIAPNSLGDFSQVILKGPHSSHSVTLESASFRETYSVGCHAEGEPIYLFNLHSIVSFLLLRYRQELLEARGFERSIIGSDDVIPDAAFLQGKENVISRYIKMTGYVRHSWPKFVYPKVLTLNLGMSAQSGATKQVIWKGDIDSIISP